jgi:uncharacterized protein (TIGR00369 family)
MEPKLTVAEITDFLDAEFPQAQGMFVVEEVGSMRARVRMPVDESHLRAGDTISGPTMFWLADFAFYVAVLASIGREAQAVTTNININFMRRPSLSDLVGEVRILKLGRRLAVGDVTLFSDGGGEPVAHATATYAIPPREKS